MCRLGFHLLIAEMLNDTLVNFLMGQCAFGSSVGVMLIYKLII